MQEKTIVNKIMKYLHSLDGCYCFKEHGGRYGTAGVPDIICCCHGRFVGLEVKTATGRTTALQDLAIRDINQAGGTAAVVRSLDEVKRLLSGLEAE